MTTITERFDGVDLIRPSGAFRWPHAWFEGFPSCCGPGSVGGILEKIVPETIIGLPVGPACFIHDQMWKGAEKSWSNFHASNAIFLTNMLEINKRRGGYWVVQLARYPFILSWFAAVSSPVGAARYWAKSR